MDHTSSGEIFSSSVLKRFNTRSLLEIETLRKTKFLRGDALQFLPARR